MCIIAYKTTEYSDWWKTAINAMEDSNPDGNGVTVLDGNSVWWEKGISIERVHELSKKYQNIILHFRIGTSGGIKPEMCHPFLISGTRGGLNTPLSGHLYRGESLLFHNGVIRGLGNLKQSDTCEAASILSPLSRISANNPDLIVKSLQEMSSMSKYIVVGKSRRHVRTATGGIWITTPEGQFSNSSYKALPKRVPITSENYQIRYPQYEKYKVEGGKLVKIDKFRY